MKKRTSLLSIAIAGLLSISGLVFAESAAEAENKKEIIIGVSPGPYNILFDDGVKPILEKQGYTFKHVSFSGLLESNVALVDGKIDFNVAQHTAYLNAFNQQRKANLLPVVHVPSVPAGIYSAKFKDLKEVKPGSKVAIPMDPSNAARAYNLLGKAGWVHLKPGVDPILASKKDIAENPAKIKIIEMDSSNIPRILADVDFAVLPGSIVTLGKIDPSTSLLSETIVPALEIMVVTQAQNANSTWAQDIKRAYQSQEFKDYLQQHNRNGYWVPASE